MATSIALAIIISVLYAVVSGASILYPYYAVRYNSLLKQGFMPAFYSDNELISKSGLASAPPISIGNPYISESQKITLPLKIKNITDSEINITIMHRLKDESYDKEKNKITRTIKNIPSQIEALDNLERKYGYSPNDELFISNLALAPEKEITIPISHTILPTTTLKNFNFEILTKTGDIDSSSITDAYEFNIEKTGNIEKIQKLINTLKIDESNTNGIP